MGPRFSKDAILKPVILHVAIFLSSHEIASFLVGIMEVDAKVVLCVLLFHILLSMREKAIPGNSMVAFG